MFGYIAMDGALVIATGTYRGRLWLDLRTYVSEYLCSDEKERQLVTKSITMHATHESLWPQMNYIGSL